MTLVDVSVSKIVNQMGSEATATANIVNWKRAGNLLIVALNINLKQKIFQLPQ